MMRKRTGGRMEERESKEGRGDKKGIGKRRNGREK